MRRRFAELPGPRGLPLLGNALSIRAGTMHRQLEAWADRYGATYRLRMGPSRLLVLADPEHIHAVLRARPDGFSRVRRMRRVSIELGLKEGVFSAGGADWRAQRTLVTTALAPANVKHWTPRLVEVVGRLRSRWQPAAQSGTPIDLQADLMRFTVDVIAGLALGAEVDTLGDGEDVLQNDLDRIFPALFSRATAALPRWRWYRSAADRDLEAAVRRVDATIDSLVSAARRRLDEQPARRDAPPNLLEAMLVASDAGDAGFDDEIVAGNVMTVLLAGEDTTANTLAWTLRLLAQNPAALARAIDEVDAIAPDSAALDLAALERLDWLDACAHEALRLKPVAPILPVEAIDDIEIDGLAIPAGTVVINLMRHAAIDPARVQDAQAFRPERWLVDAAAPMPRRLSLPFGAGPRLCPGRWLALLEIRAVLAMVLAHFRIESVQPSDGGEPAEHLAFTMAPIGLQLRLRPRDDAASRDAA